MTSAAAHPQGNKSKAAQCWTAFEHYWGGHQALSPNGLLYGVSNKGSLGKLKTSTAAIGSCRAAQGSKRQQLHYVLAAAALSNPRKPLS